MTDQLHRFTFEGAGVRGALVQLDESWRAILGSHDYPATVAFALGEAVAAAVLLSSTVKIRGSLILQVQGKGPLHMLVAQANHKHEVRGVARWGGQVPAGSPAEVFGEGRLVMTIDPEQGRRYQGIVGLDGKALAGVLMRYFEQSEQLRTGLWLFADGQRAAGLLVQELPMGREEQGEDFVRIQHLAATLTQDEIFSLAAEQVLHRLFHEEIVRLFNPVPVKRFCSCSRDKLAATLRTLGKQEVDGMIAEMGEIDLSCEFCNTVYRFDAVDARALFTDGTMFAGPKTRQ